MSQRRPTTGQEENENADPLTRRDFLISSGAASAASQLPQEEGTAKPPAASTAKAKIISGETTVKLTINGQERTLAAQPHTTLLDALRNQLALTSIKYVEDTCIAGADTVLVNGKATSANSRFVVECEGCEIQTAESHLGEDKAPSKLLTEFVAQDALQCGFCTPGFVMATTALLKANPEPSQDDVHTSLGGNICRCGTYNGIMRCVMQLARSGGEDA